MRTPVKAILWTLEELPLTLLAHRARKYLEGSLRRGFTDLFGDMHGFQSHELRIRGEVSTPFEVLRSATVINAELLQQADTLGCVKPNAIADLIVVDGNPLEDLSFLWGETTRISSNETRRDRSHA